jgi:hypothetical protein
MFETIAISLLEEIHEDSGGNLHCLPYSRAMIDAFTALNKTAIPLVVRGVVFGKQEDSSIFRRKEMQALIDTVLKAPNANGWLDIAVEASGKSKALRLFYRTIGLPHEKGTGDKNLGNYDADGSWLGHLAVIVDNTLIDLTIGQLNDTQFNINFNPPALTAPVTQSFLAGDEPLIFTTDGMLVYYMAYPNERTFELSKAWTDETFRKQLDAAGKRTAARYEEKPESALHQQENRI